MKVLARVARDSWDSDPVPSYLLSLAPDAEGNLDDVTEDDAEDDAPFGKNGGATFGRFGGGWMSR